MITAAPVVRRSLASMPAPGYTDFTSIFIASELNAKEYRTTLRHEQAHVWAGHNRRRPKVCDDAQWKIACDMEIARNIYDQEDIDTIESPRSRLAGSYLPDSIDGLPVDVLLAEDIYDWLIANPQERPESKMCASECACHRDEDGQAESVSAAEARAKLDEDEQSQKSTAAAKSAYTAILNRPPSITECMDAALRHRIVREDSHRRPSRRETGEDVILKGKLSVPRPPLVEIFVDRSGSFTPQKTAAAQQALSSIIAKYGASVRSDVWYFGGGKLSHEDVRNGGDTPYHLVADHIVMSRPKIAVIITDDDPVGDVQRSPKGTDVVCIPIGCAQTNISVALHGKDAAVIR